IFTVVNAVVMRPLPYASADRLVRVTSDFTGINGIDVGMSQPEFLDYRDRSGLFDQIAGVWAINANLTEIDQPERVEVLLASPSYFDVLGVRPQLGRLFGPQDDGPGITEVLVISDALWRRRFGASPDAIGRKLRVDNDWYTVVGVLPPGFRHPGRSVLTDVDAWAPASFLGNPFPSPAIRGNYFITGAIGRLKAGISVSQAQQRLNAMAKEFRATYPNDYPARASSRQRELAVRRALGSSRARLIRLLLIESLVLAVLGGLAGAMVTGWLLAVLLAIVPSGLPRLQEIRVDAQVVAFTAAMSVLTALVFGTLPALHTTRSDVN